MLAVMLVIADVKFAEEVAEATPNDTYQYAAVHGSSDQTTLHIIRRLRKQSGMTEITATQFWARIGFCAFWRDGLDHNFVNC